MEIARRLVDNSLMDDNHIGLVPNLFEPNGHAFGRRCGIDLPRKDQHIRRLDSFKFTKDDHLCAIHQSVDDPISTTDAKIDFRTRTGDTFRTPPLLKRGRLGPGIKQSLGRCGD